MHKIVSSQNPHVANDPKINFKQKSIRVVISLIEYNYKIMKKFSTDYEISFVIINTLILRL